jgi:glycosyltransferase involved in cell wall biosynthesis
MTFERADLTIVHPWDPWDQGIGGFESCLDSFLRYAPAAWSLELVGLTRDPYSRPIGRWIVKSFAGRSLRFLAAMEDAEPDRVRQIPLALRFAIGCRRHRARANGRIIQFHRFESAWGPSIPGSAEKVFFLHNHPEEIHSAHSDVRWHGLAPLHDYLLLHELRQASAVVAVDPRTPEWVATVLPALQGHVLYQNQWADPIIFHRTDPETRSRERGDLRARLGTAPDTKVVLFVGRLERQKDPILLLEAFALLHARLPDARLVVVGKGRLEDLLKSRAGNLALGDHVRFLGAMPREEIPAIYRGADVLICTSGFEAGPRTVFESLACGTPAVSVDVGQVREVLHGDPDIGHVVGGRNPDAIARALEKVLEGPPSVLRQERCAQAVASFTPQNGLAPVFDLYARWLSDGARD